MSEFSIGAIPLAATLVLVMVAALFMGTKLRGKGGNNDDLKTSLSDDARLNRQELQAMFSMFQDTLLSRFTDLNRDQQGRNDGFSVLLKDFQGVVDDHIKDLRREQQDNLASFERKFSEQLGDKFKEQNRQSTDLNKLSNESINQVKETVEKQLKSIAEDNDKQLTAMRNTVDEKLSETLNKRLTESFKSVSDQLETVHKGLGEMQTLATGVGDLKRVLSNVKTRGVLGEYQLGNIIEQLLTKDQYATNVVTKKGSQENVEYAVKLPGKTDADVVWIPIDSKFPLESYTTLLDAYDTGDSKEIDRALKVLARAIEGFAKDISSKYIDPPHTPDFAVMFLPIESLYGEVLRHPDLFEKLQREYHITVTGPTTLSAFLNSLQMGFRTLAIEKSSSEVWRVLSAVKAEFGKFDGYLSKMHKQMSSSMVTLEHLQGTRTNQMVRRLNLVDTLGEDDDSMDILGLDADPELDWDDQAE